MPSIFCHRFFRKSSRSSIAKRIRFEKASQEKRHKHHVKVLDPMSDCHVFLRFLLVLSACLPSPSNCLDKSFRRAWRGQAKRMISNEAAQSGDEPGRSSSNSLRGWSHQECSQWPAWWEAKNFWKRGRSAFVEECFLLSEFKHHFRQRKWLWVKITATLCLRYFKDEFYRLYTRCSVALGVPTDPLCPSASLEKLANTPEPLARSPPSSLPTPHVGSQGWP